jgi:hypothetical protein
VADGTVDGPVGGLAATRQRVLLATAYHATEIAVHDLVTVATVGQSSPATAAIPAAIASGSAMPMRGWTTSRPAAP